MLELINKLNEHMNKNISIALLALLAFTGVTASAQTDGTTSADATVTTTNTSVTGTGTVGLPPKPLTREQIEERAIKTPFGFKKSST